MTLKGEWLRSPDAATELGVSVSSLKRWRDSAGGFLEAGKHYRLGPSLNTPILWNVHAVAIEFHRRGLQARGNRKTPQETYKGVE